jgi:hypothetical protein
MELVKDTTSMRHFARAVAFSRSSIPTIPFLGTLIFAASWSPPPNQTHQRIRQIEMTTTIGLSRVVSVDMVYQADSITPSKDLEIFAPEVFSEAGLDNMTMNHRQLVIFDIGVI